MGSLTPTHYLSCSTGECPCWGHNTSCITTPPQAIPKPPHLLGWGCSRCSHQCWELGRAGRHWAGTGGPLEASWWGGKGGDEIQGGIWDGMWFTVRQEMGYRVEYGRRSRVGVGWGFGWRLVWAAEWDMEWDGIQGGVWDGWDLGYGMGFRIGCRMGWDMGWSVGCGMGWDSG